MCKVNSVENAAVNVPAPKPEKPQIPADIQAPLFTLPAKPDVSDIIA